MPETQGRQTPKQPSWRGNTFEGTWEVVDDPAAPTLSPGNARRAHTSAFTTGSFSCRAGTRDYKLFIPSGYHGQALPLVVMLHGCTQNPDDFAAGTDMNRLAEDQQFCVLYPAQPMTANSSKCWNWFKAEDQQREGGEPAILAGMARQIIHQYGLDASRVYVAGLSAGAAMATTLAMTYPDLFAAVGVHSGLPHGVAKAYPMRWALCRAAPDLSAALRKVPSGHRRCRQSSSMVTATPPYTQQCRPRCRPVRLAPSGRKGQASRSWRPTHRRAGPRGQRACLHAYSSSRCQRQTKHGAVAGTRAGHAWSGGSAKGSYTDPKGPDATGEMLRFFFQHQLA